mgnify:CR=1 FL=1
MPDRSTPDPRRAETEAQAARVLREVDALPGPVPPALAFAAQRLRDVAPHVDFTLIENTGHMQAPSRPELLIALLNFLAAQKSR